MNDFYKDMYDTVIELLEEFGQTVILVRNADRDIDPVTGDPVVLGEDQELETTGILVNYKAGDIDGTRITAQDRLLVLTAEVKPEKSDIPKLGSVAVGTIVDIKESNPAGLPLVYFVQVRK